MSSSFIVNDDVIVAGVPVLVIPSNQTCAVHRCHFEMSPSI